MRNKGIKTEMAILSFDGSYNIKISINDTKGSTGYNDSVIKVINELIDSLDFKEDFDKEGFNLEDKAISIIESVAIMLGSFGCTYGNQRNDYLEIIKSLIAFKELNRGDLNV